MKHRLSVTAVALLACVTAVAIVHLAANAATQAGNAPALPASSQVISRAFEFRAVSTDASANGETDFTGETAVFSTDERVAFLKAYADDAAAWFGDPEGGRSVLKLAALRPSLPASGFCVIEYTVAASEERR